MKRENAAQVPSLMMESAIDGAKRMQSHIDHHQQGVQVRRNHVKRLMMGVFSVVGLSGLKGVD